MRLLQRAFQMGAMIVEHDAVMNQYDPGKKIAIVVDEWGAWLKPEPGRNPLSLKQQNTLRDAILAAITLNTFSRHAERVRMPFMSMARANRSRAVPAASVTVVRLTE